MDQRAQEKQGGNSAGLSFDMPDMRERCWGLFFVCEGGEREEN